MSPIRYRIEPSKPKLKVGDWIIMEGENKVIQATEDIVKHLQDECEPWHQQEGEFVVIPYNADNEYLVKEWCEDYSGSYTVVYPLEFLQTLKG